MPKDEDQGRIVAGRYRLRRALGAGAQGTVYLAEDLGRGGAHVALKLVEAVVGGPREEPADAWLRHFRHPNWAGVLDAGANHPEGWFQAVELVPGTSLDHLEGPQSIELAWQLLEDGARVLGALHRHGLLHYDVTPGNLMLDTSAATPRFVLTDGGLAHIGPVEGVARGTPQYMAPEVTESGVHDHRADLYGLGLVAYRLVTGRDPIEGSAGDVLGRRRREDAPRASTLRSDVPAELDDLLARLLSRDPQERPHDAFALLGQLAEAQGRDIARFTHREGVAAAEGGALVGGTEALARMRAVIGVLRDRRDAGQTRLAIASAPKIQDPVLVVHGRASAGSTRMAAEAFDLARAENLPTLLLSGRDATGDRRGPLRHLVDGMATLMRAPGEEIEEIRLDLGRSRDLGREERSHAITRAVDHFVRGVERTAKRTPFLLVVQDFPELPERAQEAVRVLSRHLLALRENGGSASAPAVCLIIDVGDTSPESLLVPDAEAPNRPLLDTPALGRDEVLAYVSARFPGLAPDETDVDRLVAASDGMPGTLAALLAEGSRRGDLIHEAGRWSWNVDALDSYEIRTGLSPLLSEALKDADRHVRRLVAQLSLIESPLELSVVESLWSQHASGPLPTTPLIRTLTREGGTYVAAASRAVVEHCQPADDELQQCARELISALGASGPAETGVELARLHLATGHAMEALVALQSGWATLHAAQRARAQKLIRAALTTDASLVHDADTRALVSALLEYGPDAAESAAWVAKELTHDERDIATGLRVIGVLSETRRETEALEAVARLRGAPALDARTTAELEVRACTLLLNLHRKEEAEAALQDARIAIRALRHKGERDWHSLARFLMADAQVRFLAGSPTRALLSLQAARKCARGARSPTLMARIYSNLGIVEQQLHHPASASRRLERALALRRKLGDLDGVLSTLINLGRLHQHQGALVKSAAVFQEAASRALRHGQPVLLGKSLLFLGQVFDQQMNSRLAANTLGRAVKASLNAGVGPSAMLAAWELAPIAAALGDLKTSHDMLVLSGRAGSTNLTTYARGCHHFVAGVVALHAGDDSRAALCFRRASRHSHAMYQRHRDTMEGLQDVLASIGVALPMRRRRPAREDPARFAYRTGLWFRSSISERKRPSRVPLAKFLPRPNAASVATGSDRRLLAEAALRAASIAQSESTLSTLVELERHLALSGERYLQARVLASRSLRLGPSSATEAARLFSRAVDLADVPLDSARLSRFGLPQELTTAHAGHAESLGELEPGHVLRTQDSHALAHRMLLKHGFTATPDGRVSSALRRVLAATGRMNAGAGLDDLLQGMTEDAMEITGAERACVVLLDPNSSQQLRVEKGVSSEDLGVEVEDLSQTVIQRVIDSGEPLLLHDVFDDQELMGRPSITSLSLRSILCVPMLRGDTLYGVLYADSASAAGSFDSVDQEVLSLFAEQAAGALETHRLVADVQNSMSELKAMQERLVRGERLRTMGELSSGVAHEFNNLLTSILARVQLISMEPVSPDLKHDLDLIEKACLDAAEVVRRLQSFTRREREGDFSRLDLKDICNDAVEFLRPLWSTRRRHGRPPVTVKVRTDAALPMEGNPTELREVVTNLLKNSLDVLADGGHIDIKAREEAGGIILTVEDNGPGIPPEVRARVFDPFFTTKGERGTGLGLCLSQQIVERHGGAMSLWSETGEGTRFTIELPLAGADLPMDAEAAEPVAPALRVLVVDDDDNVRVPLCRFLEKSGFEIFSAADGDNALEAVRAFGPDVVISDVSMPGMDGIELCGHIQKEIPDVPVILMSGWTSGIDPSRARRAGASALLKKPFALQQVEVTLREISEDRTRALRRMG